jgi:peptide/nickel transport system substrate-binding protein
MVKIGEADIALNIAPQDATDKTMDFSYLNSETTYLRIDTTRAPLNDKRVRLALNYAFDREGVRGTILSKDNINATQIVMPAIPGHNFELDKKVRAYDPARAKQLLAEAKKDGVPVDTEITIIGRTAEYPNSADVMEAALTMFRAVGFNMKLKVVETGEFNLYNYKPFPESRGVTIFQSQHDNNFGDPVFSVFFRYACDGGASTLCDPALDKKVASATQAEGQDRVTQWNEIFRYLYENVVNEVWMYHMVGFARVNPRIDFKPDVTSNAEIHIQDIHFK